VAVVGDDETVQVELETVLHGGAVDLGHQPAAAHQAGRVDREPLAQRQQLVGRTARMPAAPAAHVDPQLGSDRRQPALERAEHAGGDARRVPVHPHHAAERLEPERIGQSPQDLVASVLEHHRLDQHAPELGHARSQPHGHAPAVQGEICGAGLHIRA
jgi:hypothetical protein